jgi:tryptophan synthase alpha chain
MTNNINKKFEELKNKKEIALIIGTVPGYPDIKTSFEIIKVIEESGADILELSASFSDPVADGPTLTEAHQKFLSQGINKDQMFDFYKKISDQLKIPAFIIEYANIIYKMTPDKYFSQLGRSGIGNIVIPDVSLEEMDLFNAAAAKNQIEPALIVSPTSPVNRVKKIAESSKSFVYAVSITGVTGARKSIEPKTIKYLTNLKKIIDLPIIVGFGISQPDQIKVLKKCGINGVIVCSAIINLINKNLSDKTKMLKELKKYIGELKLATKS